ncbi:MAG: Ig-like domain-containing protein, partial [Prevotellaceae bacterium]|nr:Ig-like domain-containing protein [Prevotellaceae bacterium]
MKKKVLFFMSALVVVAGFAFAAMTGSNKGVLTTEASDTTWDFTQMNEADTVGYVQAESNVMNSWNSDPEAWGTIYDYDEALIDEPIMLNSEKEFGPTKGLTFTTNAGTKQLLFRNYPANYGGVHMYANKQIKVKVPVPAGTELKSLQLMTGTTKANKVVTATGVEETLGLVSYQAAKSDDITYGPMIFTVAEGATEIELTIPSPLYIQSIQFVNTIVPRANVTATFEVPTVKAEVGKKFRNNLSIYEGAVVSFTSSNTEVATINETGAVTPVAPGRATITATILANDTHKQAQATYDVIVLGGEPWDFTLMCELDTLGYNADESNVVNTWNSDPNAWGALYDNEAPLNDDPIMLNAETEFGPTKGLTFTTGAGVKQVLFRNYPLNYGGAHMYANKVITVKVPVKEGAKSLRLMTGTTKANKIIKATGVEETLGLISYQAAKSDDITYGPMFFTIVEGTTEIEVTIPNPLYIQSIQFVDSVVPREAVTATFEAPSVKAEVGKKFRNTLTAYEGASVTYTSSNTEVATINETGAVTPVAPGRATITATILANDSHKQAEATYDVIVLGGQPWDFTLMCDLDTVGYVASESNLAGAWNTDPNAWGAVYDYDEALIDEPIMLNSETEFGPTKGLTFTTNAGTKQVLFRNYPLNYGGVHMYAN